jgi:hypothetical protein
MIYIRITCLLIHLITYSYLNDYLLDMLSVLNTHHNQTSFINEINICSFKTLSVSCDLFMHIKHCNVFVKICVNFSLLGAKNLFLSVCEKLFL